MPTIFKSNDQRMVILPKKLCEAMGWEFGDKLKCQVSGKNRLELVKE